MTGIEFDTLEEFNDFNDESWEIIKPPYAPVGTIKPEDVNLRDKFIYLIKTEGYYYNALESLINDKGLSVVLIPESVE